MHVLKKIRNYICYCGIEKDEFNAVKRNAYVSNYRVWRLLHVLIFITFSILFASSLFSPLMAPNRPFYLGGLIYAACAIGLFFFLKQDSLIAQLLIYLSISLLFLFACLITQNKPELPATSFLVFLLITPMFMIDKPFFMAIELTVASAVYLIWMYQVKPHDVWKMDVANVGIYLFVGIFIHVIANSIRIKEFVLTRAINLQKDTDDMTGLKNKGSLTREINAYLTDAAKDKGILLVLDIDRFKGINDAYGHDIGDSVIRQMGLFLRDKFTGSKEIVGRFGGDEFIVFIKGTDQTDLAEEIARDLVTGTAENVLLPDGDQTVSVSVGIAVYRGTEKNYSELFKKADIALYQAKADGEKRFRLFEA
ncbi:MAG: GGDEF domain-containing protein [Clostridia bacterium]|nr:GGDEF domain-containing protein [Clostridia bacterium]